MNDPNTMKKPLVLLPILLCLQMAWAQNGFYYGDNGPVFLQEDRSRVVLHFFQEVNFGKNFLPFNESLRKVITGTPVSNRAILDFTSDQQGTPYEIAASLGLTGPNLRSASFGIMLDDGFQMGLSHRILYQRATDEAELDVFLSAFEGVSKGKTPVGQTFIEVVDIEKVISLSIELAESGLVYYAHPDFLAKVTLLNDPLYDVQFYLHNTAQRINGWTGIVDVDIDAPEAWAITEGDSNVIVGIVDVGVEDHEDLYDTLGVSRVMVGYTTSNPGVGTGQPLDTFREAHGQASAGIIAASHNNLGGRGVAPHSKLLPVHVITESTTPLSEFVDGVTWAWKNGTWVMNNGWTYSSCSASFPSMTAAIDSATQFGRNGLGTVVVFASGADGQNCVSYPGNLPNVLAVGACNSRAGSTAYTNKGPQLDVVAPSSPNSSNANVAVMDRMGNYGYNSQAVYIQNNDYSDFNYTKWFGGTSVSCATVTGIAALVLSVNSGLTETQVRNTITSTAVNLGTPGFDNTFGHGLANAYNAIVAAQGLLPIELSSLEAQLNRNAVDVNWVTASEINSDFFGVERSYDGAIFEQIGQVKASGNTTTPVAYTYKDEDGRFGERFYRLKMVDLDGSFANSYIVRAFMPWQGGAGITRLAFDRDNSSLTFDLMDMANTNVELQVTDLSGRILTTRSHTVNGASETVSLTLESLPAGAYLLLVQGNDAQRLYQKFVTY